MQLSKKRFPTIWWNNLNYSPYLKKNFPKFYTPNATIIIDLKKEIQQNLKLLPRSIRFGTNIALVDPENTEIRCHRYKKIGHMVRSCLRNNTVQIAINDNNGIKAGVKRTKVATISNNYTSVDINNNNINSQTQQKIVNQEIITNQIEQFETSTNHIINNQIENTIQINNSKIDSSFVQNSKSILPKDRKSVV